MVVNDVSGIEENAIEIHTSDRILFKRCRRKWDFQSTLRKGLMPIGQVMTPLWFGTGFHHALEDFHSYHLWKAPGDAFEDYALACKDGERPDDWEDLVVLAKNMFNHYELWISSRDEFAPYVFTEGTSDGRTLEKHAVEVNFHVRLKEFDDPAIWAQMGYKEEEMRPVYYSGTLDGIYKHKTEGTIWVAEYKTAKAFDVQKLSTDDQVGAYMWALRKCLPTMEQMGLIQGVVYKQFKKDFPEMPTILKSGALSTNKTQRTTHALYLQALKQMYPGVPQQQYGLKYKEMLETLAAKESLEGDAFVNQQLVRRSTKNSKAQEQKILMDTFEMLNHPALTTNPTRDCAWDCNFKDVCLAIDEEADWEGNLRIGYGLRKENAELWQDRLLVPESAAQAGMPGEVGKVWGQFKKERKVTIYG